MRLESTVFVIDDDTAVRESMAVLLESAGFEVEAYGSASAFLKAYQPDRPGCLVLDVRMPQMDGLELQEVLARRHLRVPIIFITGHGDISMSVRAIRGGAVDFLEKPFDDEVLLARIREALQGDAERRREETERAAIRARFANLTKREKEVMVLVLGGLSSKDIAAKLRVSPRTVEVHRARIMTKMEAQSIVDLMVMSLSCEYVDPNMA